MKFFEKMRPEVFLHSAKYRRDKKTGKRIWGFTLIVTFTEKLGAELAKSLRHLDCEGLRLRVGPRRRGRRVAAGERGRGLRD